jgi:predicted N-acyltransferase
MNGMAREGQHRRPDPALGNAAPVRRAWARKMNIRFHASLEEIPAADWNALLPSDNPFLDHAFLCGLERHGCVRREFGWVPHHLALYRDDRLVAAAPLYRKFNSHGEYVFDWHWADAYVRHGLAYYPKLLCGVPYSPVTGPRLLTGTADDGTLRRALTAALDAELERGGFSSAHVNFIDEADAAALAAAGWLARHDWQFHWQRQPGWRDFADFLDALNAKKRKNLRQERARVARAGVRCEILHGNEIGEEDWRRLHRYYRATFHDKGNTPTLTLAFFRHLGAAMPQRVLGVFARRGADTIAGALLLRSRDTLYGRYWGCDEPVPGLHFEVCYYQGIEYCLRHGLSRFEPGAQGEHKLARGFLPAPTRSAHHLADARFRAAVGEALAREARLLERHHAELLRHSPYAQHPSHTTSAAPDPGKPAAP